MAKKKKTSPAKPGAEYDSERETRVLLEEMNQGIKIIGEQHGTIVKRLDNIESTLEQHTQELQAIKTTVHTLKTTVHTIETTVQANSSELNSVKMAVMDNSNEIKELKAEQRELKAGQNELKAGQQEIKQKLDAVVVDHEQRLEKLEAV